MYESSVMYYYSDSNIIELKEINEINLEELEDALRSSKIRKATGTDNINLELLKYSGMVSKIRFLHFLQTKIPS